MFCSMSPSSYAQFMNLALDSEKLVNAISTVQSLAFMSDNELQVRQYSAVTVLHVFW